MSNLTPSVVLAVAFLVTGCNRVTDPEHGPARLVVRNKLQVPVTSAYVLQCSETPAQLADSLSAREAILPAAERTFQLASDGCYDALFVQEKTVQNEDGTSGIDVDTLGLRAHMMIEPSDIYIVTLMP